jgi:hypothetical protein
MKIIGFDTETYIAREGKHLAYQFLSAQFFCPELKLNHFLTDKEKVAKIFKYKTRSAYFLASNAEYDFTVLCKILDKSYFNIRCLYNNARFLYGKIQRKDHCWNIYDLRNIFTNWSLAKMGDFLGFEKLEKPEYLGKRKPETRAEWAYFREYAMRDAEIGYYAGKWLFEKFGAIKLSSPSLAFYHFNKQYKPKHLYLDVSDEITEKLKLAYKGGRCESWIRGSPPKPIHTYDVVSLYPDQMLHHAFPIGKRGFKRKTTIDLCHDGFALCTVKQDTDIPLLCLKNVCEDGYIKLIFPNGIFKSWFTYPELRYFSVNKLGKILKVHEAFETEGCKFYFRDYINDFFELKKTDVDHADFWKLFMNSLYGKFAQDAHSPELQINPDNTVTALDILKSKKQAFYTNILVSAYITAHSRIKMHKLYVKNGAENLVYTDTDSIHSFKPISQIGTDLGQLSFKGSNYGTYIRSKFYILGETVRCRGMERIFKAYHVKKMIENNDVEIMSKILLRLRSAYRQHKPFLTEKIITKSFRLDSDYKRDYSKTLIGKHLLDDYTTSEAIKLYGLTERRFRLRIIDT